MSADVSAEPADLAEGRARWRTAVAGVLAKSTRRDADELGPEPERLLDSPTYEGFAIHPLYTALDALPEPALPGEWPYLRGGDALRDVKSGWKVAEAFPAQAVPGVAAEDVNTAVLAALGEGASALLIRVGESGVAPTELEKVLDGVYLSMAPVILDAGADYSAACDALLALVAEVEPDQRGTLSVDLGADPLTALLSGVRFRRSRMSSLWLPGWPASTGCGRSWSTGPPSTIWAPMPRGNLPAASRPRWPTCERSSRPASRWAMRYGRSAFGWPPTTISS